MPDSDNSSVRGNHGVGNVNEAGRVLLTFCAVNGLTVMNTWYEKNIYKYTWQHPGSRMWYCIWWGSLCRNVSVIHRADCWTDHKSLHSKITLQHKPQVHVRCCYAAYKLGNQNVGIAFNEEGDLIWYGVMVCLLMRSGMLYVMDLCLAVLTVNVMGIGSIALLWGELLPGLLKKRRMIGSSRRHKK